MGGDEVFPFEIEPSKPSALVWPNKLRHGAFRKRHVKGKMARTRLVAFARFVQPFLRVFPNGFE